MWLSHSKLLIFKGMRAKEDAWSGGGVNIGTCMHVFQGNYRTYIRLSAISQSKH